MKTIWTINPIRPDEGEPFFTVSGETEGDEIRFTVGGWRCEESARELRDTLQRIGSCVTTHALPA